MKALRCPPSPLAAAVLLALAGAAAADEAEIAQLTKPHSELSLGGSYVTKDNQRFGVYNGLPDKGGYWLLDADVVHRDDATGTWLRLSGRNLGFDNRELRLEYERQGDWGYFIELNQIPRFDPYKVNTGLQGLGTTTQTPVSITPGAGANYHLKTERDILTMGFQKSLTRSLGLQVRVRSEEKDGTRRWGQGTFGNWRFLAEPIDQTTHQIDATLNYAQESLQLSGGYYGTAFSNRNGVVNVPGCALFAGCGQMALPPDNQSHQLHLAGGYSFTNTTRASFKLAYGRITQDDAYATTPIAGAPGNLDGRIDTTLVQAGLTTRPLPKLSLRANLRYEDRDDKTPVFVYFPSNFATPTTATSDGTNEPRDIKTTSGKLEASYQLPMALRLTGGVEYTEKKRNSPPVRSVGFRETTDETSWRAELRRSISETLTGALSFVHSDRGGSDWLVNTFVSSATFATSSNQIAPLHLADRDRDLVRLALNWMPTEPLALNFRVDAAKDKYSGRGFGAIDQAARNGEAQFFSADAAYTFSDKLQATAWVARNDDRYEMVQCRSSNGDVCNPPANQVWGANLRNVGESFGLGLRAKPMATLELGADLSASKVRDVMGLVSIAGAAVGTLPDITTKVTTLQLTAKYALARNSGIRAQYVHDRYRSDDWTWNNWIYSEGTLVTEEPKQEVHFIGVAYYYRF